MHRTLETLGRIVASSSNLATYSESTSKILALGSAVALGRLFHGYEKEQESGAAVVLDAKLFSLAVCQLSVCLDSVLAESGPNTERSSSTLPSSAIAPPVAIPPPVLQTYRLNDPLIITRKYPTAMTGAAVRPVFFLIRLEFDLISIRSFFRSV
jgi:hypothetical protein